MRTLKSNIKLHQLLSLSIIFIALFGMISYVEALTPANTTINNQASVSYIVGGSLVTTVSPVSSFKVDEILNHTVTWQDIANVPVAPGISNQVITFRVENTGNGTDQFTFITNSAIAGDTFDPTSTTVYLDTNGSGVYDAGDAVYSDPTLLAGVAINVFVVSDMPGGISSGDFSNIEFSVESKTSTASAGTQLAGGGDLGTNAIVGFNGAPSTLIAAYEVTVSVVLLKTAIITDLIGGNAPMTGADIEYTIEVTVTGGGTATNLIITDPIPANTTYQTGTLLLNGGGLSDTGGNDSGDVGATTPGVVTVDLGNLTAIAGTQTIKFTVKID